MDSRLQEFHDPQTMATNSVPGVSRCVQNFLVELFGSLFCTLWFSVCGFVQFPNKIKQEH